MAGSSPGRPIESGAVAVASGLSPPDHFSGNWIEVEHGRQALALAARNFFSRPTSVWRLPASPERMAKTTTSYLVDSICALPGNHGAGRDH